MNSVTFLSFLILVGCAFAYIPDNYYKAAVVDFSRYSNSSFSVEMNLQKNLQLALDLIGKASQFNVDIIVFPENFLTRDLFFEVPDPKDRESPADSDKYSEVIRSLSRSARLHGIYLVSNLHENYTEGGEIHKYNTNVVFDRSGTVICRYRKFNLYNEGSLEPPKNPEYAYFETDFGVRMGTFTCFDILFKEPSVTLVRDYNVTDFVFPSAWMSQKPFLIAVQEQFAWSYGNNVNLLAAGMNYVRGGFEGSGIYRGQSGPPIYTMKSIDGTRLIIGRVPKSRTKYDESYLTDDVIYSYGAEENNELYLKQEDLSSYKIVTQGQFTSPTTNEYEMSTEVCQNTICCTFTINYDDSPNISTNEVSRNDAEQLVAYQIMVLDGNVDYPEERLTTGMQTCGLVRRNVTIDPSLHGSGEILIVDSSKTKLRITGRFYNKDVLITPSVWFGSENSIFVADLINAKRFSFNVTQHDGFAEVELITKGKYQMTSAIYSRVFERDGPLTKGDTPSSAQLISITYYEVLFSIIFCIRSLMPVTYESY